MNNDYINVIISGFGTSITLTCKNKKDLDKLKSRVSNILDYYGNMMEQYDNIIKEKTILEQEFTSLEEKEPK